MNRYQSYYLGISSSPIILWLWCLGGRCWWCWWSFYAGEVLRGNVPLRQTPEVSCISRYGIQVESTGTIALPSSKLSTHHPQQQRKFTFVINHSQDDSAGRMADWMVAVLFLRLCIFRGGDASTRERRNGCCQEDQHRVLWLFLMLSQSAIFIE